MMNGRYILEKGAALLLVCMIVGGILGASYAVTEEPLKAMEQENLRQAMENVTGQTGEISFGEMEITASMEKAAAAKKGRLAAVHRVVLDGQTVGYVLQVETPGDRGSIGMMVGVDTKNAVTGVAVLREREPVVPDTDASHAMLSGELSVLEQFAGKTAADDLTVGSGLDAAVGTVSAVESIADGVRAALAAAGTIR